MHAKKTQRIRKKNEIPRPSAECAGPAGGKEGSKPSGVCETFCTTLHAVCLHAKNHAIKVMQEFMQELILAFSTSRRGATDLNRFAHSAGPLTLRVQSLPVGSFSCAKTVSKWCPKGAKIEPAVKVMHSRLQNGTKSRQGVVFANVARPFWSFPGTQRDSENPSRIDFSLKERVPNVFFCWFLCRQSFYTFF